MFSQRPPDSILVRIEHQGGFERGVASVLQKSYRNYDDSVLRGELNSIPRGEVENLEESSFIEISISASAGHISAHEARHLYRLSCNVLSQRNDHGKALSLWQILFGVLLKKLLLLHMTRDLCGHNVLVANSTKSTDIFRNKRKVEPTRSTRRQKQSKSTSVSADTSMSSTTPIQGLYAQLAASAVKQKGIDRKIAANLTILSQSVSLGDKSSAVAFSKQVGARKLEVILKNKYQKHLSLAMAKLRDIAKEFAAERSCVKFLKFYGCSRFIVAIEKQLITKKKRYFIKLHKIIEELKYKDCHDAVVHIQRVGRGKLARNRVRHIRRTNAAIILQRVHRGGLGRARAAARAHHLRLKAAVRVVENAYRKHVWRRARKQMLLMLARNRAAAVIQKAHRAFLARRVLKRIRRSRLERNSALRIETQWRRYRSSVYVDDLMRRRRYQQCALGIQRVARGMLGRLRAADWREAVSAALCLQCAWRCYKARCIVDERRRQVAAGIIQRVGRGMMGRRRFNRIAAEQLRAKVQILRLVKGYLTRKVWKPRLKEFTEKRSRASKALARQLTSLKFGREARLESRKLRHSLLVLQLCAKRFLLAKRTLLREKRRRNKAARSIQRYARGMIDRRLVVQLRAKREFEEALKARNKVPIYFRMKEKYLYEQFIFHKAKVLAIQCFFRSMKARRVVTLKRRNRAAAKIQYQYRRHLQVREAKALLWRKRQQNKDRIKCSIIIQSLIRGFLGRRRANKFRSVKIVKWFITELRSKGIAARAFDSFRSVNKHKHI
jgi:hypothetical protein